MFQENQVLNVANGGSLNMGSGSVPDNTVSGGGGAVLMYLGGNQAVQVLFSEFLFAFPRSFSVSLLSCLSAFRFLVSHGVLASTRLCRAL